MADAFFGLNVAVRGLYTAQRNLDVINHNINNVTTPGYSRQETVQRASKPMAVYDGTGMIGTGAEVENVNRVRDEYLDFKNWTENITYGEWETKRTLLADLEASFNEPSDSGFTKVLDEFYGSLQELAKDPSSEAVRALVRERGVTVTKYFNALASHMEKTQTDINYKIKIKVDEVNSLGSQIQQLNRQIYATELDGSTANDLRDQRTVLIDRLSRIVNIDANEVISGKLPSGKDDKRLVITISGKAIIDHFNLSKLEVKHRPEKLNDEDAENLYELGWQDGNTIEVRGGELKGMLDMRDGNDAEAPATLYNGPLSRTPLFRGVPFYLKKLNEFVQTFAKAFNEGIIAGVDGQGHADGYTLNEPANGTDTNKPAPSGIRFFTMVDKYGKPIDNLTFMNSAGSIEDIYKNVTAKNFSVSSDIISDYKLIATADKPGDKGNIGNLNSLIKMRHNNRMFTEGEPEDFMKATLASLGIDSQQAIRISENQGKIIKHVENQKLSVAGVSIDEEMSNMVKNQQAYSAAARMISTLAEVYEILINKTGVR